MKKWLFLTILLTISSVSHAQKIKVRKVKGNQAVIEFSGATLRTGQAYELTQDEFSENVSESSRRHYVVGGSFSMTNTKSDAAGSESETDMSLIARFGWNLGSLEVGPLFTYSSDATGNIVVNTLKAGAFADYNLIPNVPGELFLYGLGATGAFGQRDGGTANNLSLMDLTVGPFVKWFPNGGDIGFRIDAGYLYQHQSGGSNGDVTVTGLEVNGGLITYF